MESYITSEWGFKVYLAGFKSNKRGVMILLNDNFEQEVYRVLKDPNGNNIILEIKIKDQMITLVNLYGPNEDRPMFYEDIKQKINEFENDNVNICGDFNLVMDPDLDTENYKQVNNPNITQTCPCNIQQFLKTVKMIILDIFLLYFSYFCSKHRLWVHVRTASARRF